MIQIALKYPNDKIKFMLNMNFLYLTWTWFCHWGNINLIESLPNKLQNELKVKWYNSVLIIKFY